MGVIFAKPGKGDQIVGVARNHDRQLEKEIEDGAEENTSEESSEEKNEVPLENQSDENTAVAADSSQHGGN
jgi:DNA gyrase subunit A